MDYTCYHRTPLCEIYILNSDIWIFYRGVAGFAIHCPCGVWNVKSSVAMVMTVCNVGVLVFFGKMKWNSGFSATFVLSEGKPGQALLVTFWFGVNFNNMQWLNSWNDVKCKKYFYVFLEDFSQGLWFLNLLNSLYPRDVVVIQKMYWLQKIENGYSGLFRT